jgi:hypothetical protein
MIIHALCVGKMSSKLQITYSFIAHLLACAGNTFVPLQHHLLHNRLIFRVVDSLKLAQYLPFFMELIMLTTWSIQITMNYFIFKGIPKVSTDAGSNLRMS